MGRLPLEILVVDDDPAVRRLFRHHLERGGYLVREAHDGARALQVLDQSKPSLVLLDYLMPEMDGPEVTRRIRAVHGDALPIILVTASNESCHIVAAFAAGADDYITKPVDPMILTARIRATIEARADRARAAGADQLVAEMLDARRVQASQLPELPVQALGWTVTGAMSPCALVGGDTFAFILGPMGATALLVDVSGHGTPAALVASAISGSLGALLLTRPAAEAMSALNLLLLGGRSGKYACVGAVTVTEHDVRITNAGLPPIAVLVDGQVVRRVEASGHPPGLVGPCEYESVRVPVAPGQRIVVMSDGLSEPFGMADDIDPALSALGLLDGSAPSSTPELESRMVALLGPRGHVDDATLLVLGRSP